LRPRYSAKQCVDVAHTSPDVLSTSAPDLTEPLEAEARPESSQKPLLSIPRVVSCAASSGYCAYACPGCVAAYHGALSRDPPLFEALFAFKGVYNSPNPSRSELVSDKTTTTVPDDSANSQSLASLQLTFSRKQLIDYTKWCIEGLDRKSSNWMNKAAEIVCNCTLGVISKLTMDTVRKVALTKYKSVYSKRKVLYFTRDLLKYLTKTTFDTRFQSFELFLEMPKVLKTRKHVTNRIVTKEDVENTLKEIEKALSGGRIDNDHYLNYKAIVLFGAFTGQRPLATIARLTVE